MAELTRKADYMVINVKENHRFDNYFVAQISDFYVSGSLVAPLPRLEIDGVGTISFPVPEHRFRISFGHCPH